MPHRLIERNLRTMGDLRFPQDRRSGIERRHFSYAAHIPERRSGTDRRDLDEHRKEWIRASQCASTLIKLYDPHTDLVIYKTPYSIVKDHKQVFGSAFILRTKTPLVPIP